MPAELVLVEVLKALAYVSLGALFRVLVALAPQLIWRKG